MIGKPFRFLARVTVLVAMFLAYAPSAVCEFNSEKIPHPMLLVLEKDNERTLDLHVGESVRITLPENASTGYRWTIDHYDEEFIEAVATEPHYPASAVGSGGKIEFVFKGKKIGAGQIRLRQWRPWAGEASVIGRFSLHLNVHLPADSPDRFRSE